jgi:hemoglobin
MNNHMKNYFCSRLSMEDTAANVPNLPMPSASKQTRHSRYRSLSAGLLLLALIAGAGCAGHKAALKKEDFFTSGSRDADQRASQRMAKSEQITNSGEGSGEKNVKKAVPKASDAAGATGSGSESNRAAQAQGKLALFDRLGGEKGLNAIVDDFLPRAMQDPRVNWPRKDMKNHGFLTRTKGDSALWSASEQNIANLKKHFVEFLALATGGPTHYEGKEMKSTHAGMRISNPEFDAAVGDLKATLDKLQIPNKEQKELLSIIESTRPEIVTQR